MPTDTYDFGCIVKMGTEVLIVQYRKV